MARQFVSTSSELLENTSFTALDSATAGTIAGWLKRSSSSSVITLGCYNDGNRRFLINRWSDGNTYLNYNGGGNASWADSSTTAWQHLTITYDNARSTSDKYRGYENGTQKVAAGSNTNLDVLGKIQIGFYAGLSTYNNGLAAECAAWSVSLTDAEIASLAAGYSPLMVRPDKLLSYWPLNGLSSAERDWVGGKDLTIYGTPDLVDGPRIIYPRRRTMIFVPSAGGGGNTLTISATEADDTSALPTTLTVTANIAATEAADTSSISVTLGYEATIAATEEADTSSLPVTITVTTNLAATEADDTSTLTIDVQGAGNTVNIAATEDADTSSITGTVDLTVNIAATEAADTSSITMVVLGLTIEAVEEDDNSALPVSLTVTANIAATEANDTSTLTGAVNTGASSGNSTDIVVLVESSTPTPLDGIRVVALSSNSNVFTVSPRYALTDANGQYTFTISAVSVGGPLDLTFFIAADPTVDATVSVTVLP